MINTDLLCMNCMKLTHGEEQCPFCGFRADTPQLYPYLPVRTVIGGRYMVGRAIEYAGDGITYMGWDMTQKLPVNIREFLPDTIMRRGDDGITAEAVPGSEITCRDCMQDFLELWRKLVRMRGLASLLSAFDIVEDNETAYAVCDHIESITLRDYLLQSKNGYMSWEHARSLFMPVLSTLGALHNAGIVHRGISPATLVVTPDNKVKITGFYISQARTARSDISAQLYPGYAAIEQYGFEGRQGPWTDIYAFAAVLYRALTGSTPIEATSRVTNDKMMIPGNIAEQIPAYVINALINAMQILPEDRIRSVEYMREELSASASISAGYTGDNNQEKSAPVPEKKKGMSAENKKIAVKSGIISAVVCLVVIAGIVLIRYWDKIPFLGGSSVSESQSDSQQQGKPFPVPDFRGQNYSDIRADMSWNATFVFTTREEYSDKYEAGTVISQNPEHNTTVTLPAGEKIKMELVISKGKPRAKIPNVVGKKYEDAVKELEKAGFKNIKKVTKLNDGTQTEGIVQSVTPMDFETEFLTDREIFIQVWGAVEESSESQSSPAEDSGESESESTSARFPFWR